MWVVEILIIGAGRRSLSRTPGAIVTAIIGHALGVGVSHLVLQAIGIALLQERLKSIVTHAAHRGRPRDLRQVALQSRIPG